MSVSPIGGFTPPTIPTLPTGGVDKASAADGSSFGDLVTKGIDSLQQTQATADNLATQAATGDLADVHDFMIASTQASLATELTVAVRNRAVEAFNDIMRMQI